MASGKTRISLDEIRKKFLIPGKPVSSHLLTRLRRDSRIGAQRLYEALTARFERERGERVRLDAMLNFERVLWKSGVRDIAGVDEAGVGPLAGPVVAAAVMFTADPDICGIDDSKRLDAPTRDLLAVEIRAKSAGIGIGLASVSEIDTVNIYHAALLAMRRAIEALPRPPHSGNRESRATRGTCGPAGGARRRAANSPGNRSRRTDRTTDQTAWPLLGMTTHSPYRFEGAASSRRKRIRA